MEKHNPEEVIGSAQKALILLKEGNERYVLGQLSDKTHYADERKLLRTKQNPFAIVLTCADSRTPPEIFFDQELGDLFVIRNAGNVCDPITLGSMEYAVEHLGTRLVVICGHTNCGAVRAALTDSNLPKNIQIIADYIKPAIALGGDIEQITKNNVEEMVRIASNDSILRHSEIMIVGALYNVKTGVVTWLRKHRLHHE